MSYPRSNEFASGALTHLPMSTQSLTLNRGILILVATPIGNLADLSVRAQEVLRSVDLIACEDTRTTRTLLNAHAIHTPMQALHQHNEHSATPTLIDALQQGKRIALVSDAGTPAISDPGAWLVAAAHAAGVTVQSIPGPNAAITAYAASGFLAEHFVFAGFLPATASKRRATLNTLKGPNPIILYEAPHRVAACLKDLNSVFGPTREVLIARELSKKFEEIARLPLAQANTWLTQHPHRTQGEFVLVIGPGEPTENIRPEQDQDHVLRTLLDELPVSAAARVAAHLTGASRKNLYARALELQSAAADSINTEDPNNPALSSHKDISG